MSKTAPTALLSVYDKAGIEKFAAELAGLGWQLLGSRGTCTYLAERDIKCRDAAELIGEPVLGHRVVTLSRGLHAALLSRDTKEDRRELKRIGVPRIDLVCIDLYPLERAVAAADGDEASVIEQTDIGGPTLLRSAAKGRRIAVSHPAQRAAVVEWLKADRPDGAAVRRALAAEAEKACARYALVSAGYLSEGKVSGQVGQSVRELKYGENPWQVPAHHLSLKTDDPLALDRFELLAGAEPGWCNLTDADRLLQTVTHIAAGFDANFGAVPSIAVAAKHGNACGAAASPDGPADALVKAVRGDARAIFGGAVMVNFALGEALAETLLRSDMPDGKKRKLDTVCAPEFSDAAAEMLTKRGCRLLANPALATLTRDSLDAAPLTRSVRGGFLRQPNFTQVIDLKDPDTVAAGDFDPRLAPDLVLAWAVGATSSSNTVCVIRDGMLLGNGMGQMDRVTAARHAVDKAREAGHTTAGAVGYSDSFFPFADALLALGDAGVRTVLSCSGSVNDERVRAAALDAGLTLVLVPHVKARGFYGH
ncbi:MAG: hypothetical protein U9Q03_02815 [Patescibacteria group bacterium]|nr:hypothetical protein [Patescibacteria group bacterium]